MALMRVRYVGLSDIRAMSADDLRAAGVGVDKDMEWNPQNRHTLIVSDPSEDLLSLFRAEGTFQVEEVDKETGQKVGDDIVSGKPLDDTGDTLVDGVTGETSTGKGKSKS